MKEFKIFECVVKDDMKAFVEFIPSYSKKDLLAEWGGNGEFVQIKDVTNEYVFDLDCLMDCMSGKRLGNWGKAEQDIIRRILQKVLPNAR